MSTLFILICFPEPNRWDVCVYVGCCFARTCMDTNVSKRSCLRLGSKCVTIRIQYTTLRKLLKFLLNMFRQSVNLPSSEVQNWIGDRTISYTKVNVLNLLIWLIKPRVLTCRASLIFKLSKLMRNEINYLETILKTNVFASFRVIPICL